LGKYAGLHAADPAISLVKAFKHFHNELTHRDTLSPYDLYLLIVPTFVSCRDAKD